MVLDGNPLENLYDFREKGIGDFGKDEAKNAASPRNQCSSLRIRIITKLLDHLPNPLGKLRIDGGDMIDGPRHSGGGYLGTPGDCTDIHNLANAGTKRRLGESSAFRKYSASSLYHSALLQLAPFRARPQPRHLASST